MTEILAPAGGQEQLIAAVRAGADAVYLGLKSFSARAGAKNFDSKELKSAVSYCHARNVNVHVALNTLVADDELENAACQIEQAALSGADAIIVQDLAVAKLIKRICPDMPMHASTQMTVYNLDGVEKAAELGFSRCVLARELELPEISSITENSRIETEVFIHGALCMCVSGACYLSSMIGGRSGNRGRCAQPCRLDFRLDNKPFALSLKDMSSIDYIDKLAKAGVCSFKIEGRMKRPEYVACAVKAVRDALEGKKPDMDTLKNVFSRSGFTSGYIEGKRTFDMFGVRTAEDVQKSAGALGKAREIYRRERQSVGVDMSLILEGGTVYLTVDDGVNSTVSFSHLAESAVTKPLDKDTAKRSLEKLGDTPFFLKDLYFESAKGLTVRPAELNRLRREAAEKLLKIREAYNPKNVNKIDLSIPRVGKREPFEDAVRVRVQNISQIPTAHEGEIIVPLDVLYKDPSLIEKYNLRLICEADSVCFEKDAALQEKKLCALKNMGLKKVFVENIGALNMAARLGFEVHGGFGLNIFNSLALREYENLGLKSAVLSFELSADRINALLGMKKGVTVYGNLPLMRMRACPAKSKNGCAECSGINTLTDRKNAKFTLVCENKKYSTLLNSVPLYVGDRHFKNADFRFVYFTTEDAYTANAVYNKVVNHEKFDQARTTGLYFRELE